MNEYGNTLPTFSKPPQEHHVVRDMAEAAVVGAVIGAVIGPPLANYINKSRKNRLRMMWGLTVFLLIAMLPFIGMAMLPPGNAGFLWFTAPGVLLLAVLWPAMIFGKHPADIIEVTYQRP